MPDDESTRVAEHGIHMTDQFDWRAHLSAGAEVAKLRRCATNCFLSSVRKRGKEMLQNLSLQIHVGSLQLDDFIDLWRRITDP